MLRFSPRARGCSADTIKCATARDVFPACAGMFPFRWSRPLDDRSFPRVRGDVPQGGIQVVEGFLFSPRARGCSFIHPDFGYVDWVFPACAGMFLGFDRPRANPNRFPRVRGDVPDVKTGYPTWYVFSPRARGCSVLHQNCVENQSVFPACAGMFLIHFAYLFGGVCFPRVRGDVPRPSASAQNGK